MRILLIIPLVAILLTGGLFVYAQEFEPGENPQGNSGGTQPGGSGMFGGGSGTQPPDTTSFLTSLYRWLLAAVGISALFAIVFGGILHMLSGPNITKVDQAKGWILRGFYGILIAGFSVAVLYAINPDLVAGFDIRLVIRRALPSFR